MDYFRIEVPTAGMLEVRTFGGIDTYGTLYDTDSRIVTENDDDDDIGHNFLISRHVAAGVYYIEVRHYDLFGTGSYQLVSQFTPGEGGDDHGDTLATATVIEPDSTTAGRIDPEGDVDYFRIEVPTAGTLEVRTLGGIDTYGTLYDADGRFVTENDDDFGDTGYNFLISRRVAAGVYYIEVRHYRLLGTGPYQLVSRFTPGEGGDDHGDTLATATVIEPDSTTAGRIDPADDVDCFRIEIPTAGTLEVRSSSHFDTYGVLFNANGDFITESDDEGGGRDFRISWEVVPGVYYIEVSHFSFSATGAYQLISRFEPAGEPLITDHPADATLIAGESHTLRVQAEGDGISYQWYVGAVGDTSTPIDGATGPVLEIAPVTTLSYWVWVGAAGGGQDSAGATVTVDTTPAGGTWTGVASGVASTLRDVAWLGDLFVAVGDGGVILTSPDGVTWTSQASGIGQQLESVAWNGNEYVAVGAQGAVVSSTDGVIWTARHSGTSAELNGVAWNGTAFWAVGPAGSVRHSPDGRSWSESAANVPALDNIHALDGVLCAVGPDNLLTSSDGTLWTPRLSTSDLFYDSVTSNGQDWLTVGSDGAVRLSSDRGATWTPAQIVADTWLRGAASDGSGFVVVGNAGAIYTSPQGAVWTRRDSGGDGILHAVAWNGRCYVAVGENGRILRSTGAWSGAAASTYAQWAASWGLTEGAGAPTADWDGDGTPNVLEFITGARPGDPAPRALAYPSVSFDPIADQVTVTYPFNPRAAGLEAGVQVSTDLSHWGDVFPTISSDGSGYTEWHRVVLSRSLFPAASFRFTYRLP